MGIACILVHKSGVDKTGYYQAEASHELTLKFSDFVCLSPLFSKSLSLKFSLSLSLSNTNTQNLSVFLFLSLLTLGVSLLESLSLRVSLSLGVCFCQISLSSFPSLAVALFLSETLSLSLISHSNISLFQSLLESLCLSHFQFVSFFFLSGTISHSQSVSVSLFHSLSPRHCLSLS